MADLSAVYNRLNGVSQYHPFSANTFADWASEAGDTVKISREGTEYSAPVHKQSLVWRGKHAISMESTGTKERTAIERVSNTKETTTSSGVSSSRAVSGGVGSAVKELEYNFYSEDGMYQSQLHMDEERFTTIFAKTGINDIGEKVTLATMINQNAEEISLEARRASAAEGELTSSLRVTANAITAEVTRATAAEGSLSGKISVEAGKITQIVSAVGKNDEVTAASIVLAINNAGESEAKIDANKVYIGNQKSTTVINGKLNASDVTASYIAGKIAQIANVAVQNLHSERGGISVQSVSTSSFYQGSVSCYVPHAITSLQIVSSGNTYTLQRKWFSENDWTNVGSFSRAVSSWSVGGGSGKVNVTANPQNQTKSVPVSIGGPNSISSNGTYTYKVYYENADGDDVETGASRTVTVDVGGTSQYVDDIDLGEIAVSSYQPTGYEGAVLLTQLPNAIKNNQNTYVWFKVKALDQNGHSLYTKKYYCASA